MTNDEKAAKIAEARELLADLNAYDHVLAVRELLPPREDPLAKWRAEMAAFEAERAERGRLERQQQQAAEPKALDAAISKALARERKRWRRELDESVTAAVTELAEETGKMFARTGEVRPTGRQGFVVRKIWKA